LFEILRMLVLKGSRWEIDCSLVHRLEDLMSSEWVQIVVSTYLHAVFRDNLGIDMSIKARNKLYKPGNWLQRHKTPFTMIRTTILPSILASSVFRTTVSNTLMTALMYIFYINVYTISCRSDISSVMVTVGDSMLNAATSIATWHWQLWVLLWPFLLIYNHISFNTNLVELCEVYNLPVRIQPLLQPSMIVPIGRSTVRLELAHAIWVIQKKYFLFYFSY